MNFFCLPDRKRVQEFYSTFNVAYDDNQRRINETIIETVSVNLSKFAVTKRQPYHRGATRLTITKINQTRVKFSNNKINTLR